MRKLFFVLLLSPLLLQLHGQDSQTTEQQVIVILNDKSELNGVLIEEMTSNWLSELKVWA